MGEKKKHGPPRTGWSGQDGGKDSSIRGPRASGTPFPNRDPRAWRREAKQPRGTPLHFHEGMKRGSGGAAPGQTLTDFSNLRVNYYSDLVHVQHIATPGGAAPGQTVMVLSETGPL